MSQLTIPNPHTASIPVVGQPGLPGRGRRTMRHARMVSLRSSLPTGLLTLRHDIPEYLDESTYLETTTPKVDHAERAAETTAGKGGEAQW
jgi:hypothetical protein